MFFWQFFILIGIWLLYNVVFLLYSKVNQPFTYICISHIYISHIYIYMYVYINPLFWSSFPFRTPQSTKERSLCCTVVSLVIYFIHGSVAQCQRILLPVRSHGRLGFDFWVWKIPWRRKWQPTPSILAWEIPWTEEPGGLQVHGVAESYTTEHARVYVNSSLPVHSSPLPAMVSIHLFSAPASRFLLCK